MTFAASILVLSEDGGPRVVRALAGQLLRWLDSRYKPEAIDLEPADEGAQMAMQGNLWKDNKSGDGHRRRVEIARTVATKIMTPTGYVFIHIDADRRWGERDKNPSENLQRYVKDILSSVERHVDDLLARRGRPDDKGAVLSRLCLLAPYAMIESWLLQNTVEAKRLCHKHHRGRDVRQARRVGEGPRQARRGPEPEEGDLPRRRQEPRASRAPPSLPTPSTRPANRSPSRRTGSRPASRWSPPLPRRTPATDGATVRGPHARSIPLASRGRASARSGVRASAAGARCEVAVAARMGGAPRLGARRFLVGACPSPVQGARASANGGSMRCTSTRPLLAAVVAVALGSLLLPASPARAQQAPAPPQALVPAAQPTLSRRRPAPPACRRRASPWAPSPYLTMAPSPPPHHGAVALPSPARRPPPYFTMAPLSAPPGPRNNAMRIAGT